jgi:hypothetical protein
MDGQRCQKASDAERAGERAAVMVDLKIQNAPPVPYSDAVS